VTQERTSKGFTPHVITNDTNKASLPVNRLERHAGKLARAVLRGGGDGDTASLPDPPRCSGFRQQLTPGVGMTSDVKSWRKHSQSVFFSGMSSRYSGPSEEPEPVTSVGCSCWYAWDGYHLTGLRRVPASRSARGFRSASSRRRGLHHTGAAPLPIDVANPLSCESKDDLSVGLIVSPEPAWQSPT
jgi:hypothetical protein